MDMITLAMAKAYSDRKGGYVETKRVEVLPTTTAFYDLAYGYITLPCGIVPNAVYTVTINGEMYQSVAKETVVDGNKIFYINHGWNDDFTPATNDAWVIRSAPGSESCDFSWGVDVSGNVTIAISAEVETVHTIDPKYLPREVLTEVVDFDELGLTTPILLLYENGGGRVQLGQDNEYGARAKDAAKAFPPCRPFAVSLSIPGSGVMTVTPVYTTTDSKGVRMVHFDSYLATPAGLNKFFVRVEPYALKTDGELDAVAIEVGFYT